MENSREPSNRKGWVQVSVIAAAGTQLGAVLGASAFIGAWLDGKFETRPWLFSIFAIGGFVGGFWSFFQILKKYGGTSGSDSDDTRSRDRPPGPGPD